MITGVNQTIQMPASLITMYKPDQSEWKLMLKSLNHVKVSFKKEIILNSINIPKI